MIQHQITMHQIITPISNTVPEFDLQQANLSVNTLQFLQEHFSDYKAFNFDFNSLNNYLLDNPYALEFNLNDGQNATFLSLQMMLQMLSVPLQTCRDGL